jgi:translation elongation factor EF-1beta
LTPSALHEQRIQVRVKYAGNVKKLYESIIEIEGVVREEYIASYIEKIEGDVVDSVWFRCDIVFNSEVVSVNSVTCSLSEIEGVESVKTNSD